MTLIITEPIKTVNGLLTKALAGRSQLFYQFQREDYLFTSAADLGGGLIQLAIADTTGLSINDLVYIKGSIYNSTATVSAVSPTAINVTGLTFNGTDSGYLNNLTARANYRLAISIFLPDGTRMFESVFRYVPNQAGFLTVDLGGLITSYQNVPSTFSFAQEYFLQVAEEWENQSSYSASSPASSNVGGFVQLNSLSVDPVAFGLKVDDYVFVDWTDGGTAYPDGSYKILALTTTTIQLDLAYNTGSTGANVTGFSYIPTTILQSVLAKKQLLQLGGANMWENLLRNGTPFAGGSINDPSGLAELVIDTLTGVDLTLYFPVGTVVQCTFVDPFYPDGPYTVVNSHFSNNATNVEINVAFAGETDFTISSPLDVGKLLTRFENPVMWRGWNRTAACLIDSEYTTRVGSSNPTHFRFTTHDINKVDLLDNENYILPNNDTSVKIAPIGTDNNLDPPAYYQGVTIRQNAVDIPYAEVLFYEIRDACPQPIMLDWINTLGGVEQWLFSVNQQVTYEVGEGVLAEAPINRDIEFITRTKQRFPGASKQRIRCRAERLTGDQLRALKEIKQTNSLRVYLTKDGSEYIDAVVVNSLSTQFETEFDNHTFEVEIEFPDDFDFFTGKKY